MVLTAIGHWRMANGKRSPVGPMLVATVLCVVAAGAGVGAQRPGTFIVGQSDGPRPLMYGFALECNSCRTTRGNAGFGRGPAAIWHYTEYPRVAAVLPGGAAERAGIKTNDLIIAVNGVSILTGDGARRFSGARNGDEVRLTIERDLKAAKAFGSKPVKPVQMDVTVALGVGRGRGSGTLMYSLTNSDSLVYAGHIGTTQVEVSGNEPVIASRDSTGALVLRIGDSMVRIRPEAAPPPAPREPPARKP